MSFLGKRTMAQGYDWILIAICLTITSIGLAAIYSVDLSKGEDLIYIPVQLISLLIGLLVLFVVGQVHRNFFFSNAKIFYFISLVLLIGVLVFGVNIRGTMGWFRFAGFSFQPVEFAKFSLIVWLSWWAARQGRVFEKWQFIASSGFMTLCLVALVLLQPDLGSALLLVSLWFIIMILANTKKWHILVLLLGFLISFLIGWNFLFKDYQKERLLNFVDPSRDPLGSGYNVIQSMIAIGSGNFFGRGLGFGSQSQLRFLPEAQTDFIFSVIAEELGFIGVVMTLLLFLALIFRLVSQAKLCRDDFSCFVLLGIVVIFLVQLIVNIGAATGILPVTGVTLPFLSYGGSSLIINFGLIGLAQSMIRSFDKEDILNL